jgi:hypothetical protein
MVSYEPKSHRHAPEHHSKTLLVLVGMVCAEVVNFNDYLLPQLGPQRLAELLKLVMVVLVDRNAFAAQSVQEGIFEGRHIEHYSGTAQL